MNVKYLLEVVSALWLALVNEAEDVCLVILPGDGLPVPLPHLVPPLRLRVLQDLLLLHPPDPPPELLLADAAVPVQVDLVADDAEPPLAFRGAELVEVLGLVLAQESLVIILVISLLLAPLLVRQWLAGQNSLKYVYLISVISIYLR